MAGRIVFQFDDKLEYQQKAVHSVTALFHGMPRKMEGLYGGAGNALEASDADGRKNREICSEEQLLRNLQQVQKENRLFPDDTLDGDLNFTVEMETGTGKTYVYLRTLLELHQEYGFTKFIIAVPSIAIRKGVEKSMEQLRDHFLALYGLDLQKHSFIYDSTNPQRIQAELVESQELCICVMNIQAFNKDTNKIRTEDESGKILWKEIQAIRPIVIMDEPQKMEGESKKKSKSLQALEELHPLFTLRYSATHRQLHHPVYKLDSYEAYRQHLVKEIQVKTVHGIIPKDYPYVRYRSFTSDLKADIELFRRKKGGQTELISASVRGNTSLFELSGGLAAYKDMRITEDPHRLKPLTIESPRGTLHLAAGHSNYEMNREEAVRIQIRLAIQNHFEKQLSILKAGKKIKALTLFFIDSVEKVRDFEQADGRGEYLKLFDEEYEKAVSGYAAAFHEFQDLFPRLTDTYAVREGYFAVDKKSRAVEVDTVGKIKAKSQEDIDRGISLILEKKDELISFDSPLAFIFSHSALREGWDNPNVFTLCTLKSSGSEIAKKQEIGRGLRLPVDSSGNRCMDPSINELTVIANDYYDHFASALQADFNSSIHFNPKEVTVDTLFSALLAAGVDRAQISDELVFAWKQDMVQKGILSSENFLTSDIKTLEECIEETIKTIPVREPHAKEITSAFEEQMRKRRSRTIAVKNGDQPVLENDLQPYMKETEFQKWHQNLCSILSKPTIYKVQMDKSEFIRLCRERLNEYLENRGRKREYQIETGRGQYADSGSFQMVKTEHMLEESSAFGRISYETKQEAKANAKPMQEAVNSIMYHTMLPRRTIIQILQGVKQKELLNSQEILEEVTQLLQMLFEEEKASHVSGYDIIPGYERDVSGLFCIEPIREGEAKKPYRIFAAEGKKAMHKYYRTCCKEEYEFVKRLEEDESVLFFAKFAEESFLVGTPYGDWKPSWAVVCGKEEAEEYFIVEWQKKNGKRMEKGEEKKRLFCAQLHLEAVKKALRNESIHFIQIDSYQAFLQERKEEE